MLRLPKWLQTASTLLALSLLMISCGGGGDTTLNNYGYIQNSVVPLYNLNGNNWNDYLTYDGTGPFNASDSICDPAVDSSCLHGGEMRSMEVPGRISCAGLTAADNLLAFDWTCDDSVNPIRYISTGLKPDKGLADLIDFDTASFRENYLIVRESGTAIATSAPDIWWNNDFVVYHNSNTMNVGEIHIVTQDVNARHYITADKVAMVIKPGVTLTGSPTPFETVVMASLRKFIWVEGTIDVTGDHSAVYFASTDFSVIRNVNASNANSYGIILSSSTNNSLSNITANANSTGIRFEASSNNSLTGITANGNTSFGIYFDASPNNRLSDIVTSENNNTGLTLAASSDNNSLTNITASRNTNSGIYLFSSSNNSLINITASDNSNHGVSLNSSSYNNLGNITVSENTGEGIFLLTSSNNNTLNNINTSGNNLGIYLSYSSDNTFTGELQTGSNLLGECKVSGGTNPGLIDVTCVNQGSSDASLTTGVSTTGSFVDALNGDYSLLSTDTIIRDLLSVPTGNNTLSHIWSDASTTILLRNAIEISGDGLGNDNLLCESDETCLYTPNIAAYQGHGSFVPAGTFTDGVLSGITLLRYENNGY